MNGSKLKLIIVGNIYFILWQIKNVTKQGFEPFQLFCNEMDKIKEDYFSSYDLEDMEKFFLTKLVLELFNNGWFQIESSREILIRDIKSDYKSIAKKQTIEFNIFLKSVNYIDDLDKMLEINKLKLQDHAEFLMNSGWNPFI